MPCADPFAPGSASAPITSHRMPVAWRRVLGTGWGGSTRPRRRSRSRHSRASRRMATLAWSGQWRVRSSPSPSRSLSPALRVPILVFILAPSRSVARNCGCDDRAHRFSQHPVPAQHLVPVATALANRSRQEQLQASLPWEMQGVCLN